MEEGAFFSVVGDSVDISDSGEDEEEDTEEREKPAKGKWTYTEIITLIEFPFELMSDLQGEFWKLTEKELIWIRATTKRSIDKIPIKLLETLSWVGFPVVLAYVVGKRIRHMWKITGTGREEERASEGEQQETTREGEKKLMIKKGF